MKLNEKNYDLISTAVKKSELNAKTPEEKSRAFIMRHILRAIVYDVEGDVKMYMHVTKKTTGMIDLHQEIFGKDFFSELSGIALVSKMELIKNLIVDKD